MRSGEKGLGVEVGDLGGWALVGAVYRLQRNALLSGVSVRVRHVVGRCFRLTAPTNIKKILLMFTVQLCN